MSLALCLEYPDLTFTCTYPLLPRMENWKKFYHGVVMHESVGLSSFLLAHLCLLQFRLPCIKLQRLAGIFFQLIVATYEWFLSVLSLFVGEAGGERCHRGAIC